MGGMISQSAGQAGLLNRRRPPLQITSPHFGSEISATLQSVLLARGLLARAAPRRATDLVNIRKSKHEH